MTDVAAISEGDVQRGLSALAILAADEYGLGLEELFAADEPVKAPNEYDRSAMDTVDSRDAFWRVGRLVGITIKEPFSRTAPLGDRPTQTGARRYWELKQEVLGQEHPDWWQYTLIVDFLASQERAGEFDWLPPRRVAEADQVARFLQDAQEERGVFRAIAKGIRPHLCRDRGAEDPSSRGRLSDDPVALVTAGSIELVVIQLTKDVPWLADPRLYVVTTGFALLIASYGLDAFCRKTLPAPRSRVVET